MNTHNARRGRKLGATPTVFWRQIQRRFPHLGLALAVGFAAVSVRAQTPATLTDLGATAPTPGRYDIAQTSTSGQTNFPDGLNYYTDNQANHGAGEPGQTFTTSNSAAGYLVKSLALKTGGGSTSGTTTPQGYWLHVYSVAAGSATLLATYGATNVTFNDGDWLQWSGLNLSLSPNANYAYSFGKASSSGAGWEAMGNTGGNLYAGGELGLLPVAGGAITFGASHSYDAVFDLGLSVPIFPVAGTPAITPTNLPVYAGTPVTLTDAASGQAPLFYQWRTDGGSGGTRTNIPGATATNLSVNSTGWKAGTYRYVLVVTNSAGASTSSVAALDLVAGSAPVLVSDIAPNSAVGYAGGSLTFTASFTGTLPIWYQWQANTGGGSTNLPGATNTVLTLGNLQPANSGTYTLLASNTLGGPVSSSAAHLTVQPQAPFVRAVLQDNPVGYWRLNETGSTTSGNLTAADVTGNFNGIYGAAAVDGVAGPNPAAGFTGLEFFNTAVQFTYGIANSLVTLPPLNLNTNTVTLSAWIYPIGTPADYCGLVFCRPGGDASGLNFASGGQLGYTWNQNNSETWSWVSDLVPPLQQWSFVVLVISPGSAILYLCNTNGVQSATNAIPHTAEAFNGSTLIGGDTADGGNGARTFNGSMDEVSVFNTSLSEQQVLNLYYSAASGVLAVMPPVISPASTVFSGTTVTFTENAFGLAPLQYQWQTNGVSVPGATNSSLIITNTTTAASGIYSVLVSNSASTNDSPAVYLTVNPPAAPFFTQQPAPAAATNYVGGLVMFTAAVNGTPPISLQWQYNGSNIPYATTSSLILAGLQTNFAGSYTLSAANSFGTTNSLPVTLNVLPLPNPAGVNVLTYHYDNTRQGQNTNEFLLTPANVNATNFGKLFTYPVDGYVYAQPLIMNGLNLPGRGVRNVLFVSTMHDSVFAFDADSNGDTNGGLLWKTNLGISSPSPSLEYGARYHPGVGNLDVVPEEGAASAPVIDPASGTIFVDAFTREVVAGVSTNYHHRIHALNITNGCEQPYSPAPVVASVRGTGVNGDGTNVSFSDIQHMQRPALTLAGGILYACYGSHDDTDPYHGWVIGFNATNLLLLTNYIFNTTPNATVAAFGANAGEGSLWMGGNGLSVDANTNLYFETGNGSFSANTNGGDYADSFVKLSTTTNRLAVADYFTPYNQLSLQNNDADLGSGGPLLLPDSVGSAAHPHLIVGAGKEGKIYLLDRDHMGHYNGTDGMNGTDSQIVEELPGAIGGVWSSPAYFNNHIYYQGNGDVMKAFLITNGFIAATPDSRSATSFGFPGATPTLSANGTNDGIAWIIQADAYLSSGPAVLHAYNATNLAQELYNSGLNLARDNPGGAVKMTPPVIANGKVYVGAEYAVSVYGLAVFLAAPVISPIGGTFTNSVLISLTETTGGASIYYTLDGTTPTAGSTLYTGPFNLTSNALLQAIALAPGAANSAVASASFINTAAAGNGSGLTGAYYANHTSANPFAGAPVLVQTNATINFNWGTSGPSPLVGATNFTVRWTGTVQAQFNESYNFQTVAEEGVRLYVNGQLLIDHWVDNAAATTNNGSIALTAQQFYNLELDYYQTTNNASVSLFWSSPSTPQAILPQTQLYPFTNPPPAVVLTSPANRATNFTAAASVTLSAEADALYNPIRFVSLYLNGSLLGSVSNQPYALTATGLAAGDYALTAVAVDGSGLSSTSAPVNITVASGSALPYGLTSNATVNAFLNLPTTYSGTLPALLSDTGAFSNTTNRTPAAGLIPYAPNEAQWKDNALSSWLLAVPNSSGLLTPGQQIQFQPTNAWTFPAGSVFVKNFDLVVNETNPAVPPRRLETELLVRDNNGSVYGLNYKWRPDNSDADLLASSLSEDILITNATGVRTQTWYYASPSDCQECHNTAVANNPSGVNVLGVNARQLNGNQTYPATGVTDNQLRTLNRLGLFYPAMNEADIASYSKLSAMTNLSASLQDRVRSYLDANCEECHQPGGQGITWDARYDTPLAQQNITNYPAAFSLGISDHACVVKAKDIWRSVLVSRVNTLNQDIQMPDFRNLIDTNAVQVIRDWINSLPGTPALAPPAILPNGGSFFSTVNLAIQSPDTNAIIYYTLDGSQPTTNSSQFASTLNLVSNVTVSAFAADTNFYNSIVVSALFSVQPLYFTATGFLTNQQLQLGFMGVAGSNYVLQASTNLTTWTPLSTNNTATNWFNFLDPNATNYPYRFYRVLQQ